MVIIPYHSSFTGDAKGYGPVSHMPRMNWVETWFTVKTDHPNRTCWRCESASGPGYHGIVWSQVMGETCPTFITYG